MILLCCAWRLKVEGRGREAVRSSRRSLDDSGLTFSAHGEVSMEELSFIQLKATAPTSINSVGCSFT